MPTLESPSTVAMAETAVCALAWKMLTTKTTGNPAPRPDGKNLWIEIDIDLNQAIALFQCQDEEHVRDNSPRSVTFRADQDCLLTFTNQGVFNCGLVQLFAHQEKTLPVKDDGGKISETFYNVYTMTPAIEAVVKPTETMKIEETAKRPPVIVVP
jgi:hypothetical protein